MGGISALRRPELERIELLPGQGAGQAGDQAPAALTLRARPRGGPPGKGIPRKLLLKGSTPRPLALFYIKYVFDHIAPML